MKVIPCHMMLWWSMDNKTYMHVYSIFCLFSSLFGECLLEQLSYRGLEFHDVDIASLISPEQQSCIVIVLNTKADISIFTHCYLTHRYFCTFQTLSTGNKFQQTKVTLPFHFLLNYAIEARTKL